MWNLHQRCDSRFPVHIAGAIAIFFAGAADCSALELSDITRAYEQQDAKIQSLYVSWSDRSEAIGKPADLHKYLYTQGLSERKEVFACKGEMRFYSMRGPEAFPHLVELEPDGTPRMVSVQAAMDRAWNGQVGYLLDDPTQQQTHPAGHIVTRDNIGGSFLYGQEILRANFRMWPDGFGADDSYCQFHLGCFAALGKCRLRTDTELVSGTECVVLEWEETIERTMLDQSQRSERIRDKLYCDPQRGFAMVKYERFSIDDEAILLKRVTASDFVEVVDGFWFPQTTIHERCAPPQDVPRRLRGVPLLRRVQSVLDIHANDVPDEVFTPEILPGTMIYDARYMQRGRPVSYTIPEDPSELAATIEAAVKAAREPRPSAIPSLSLPELTSSSSGWKTIVLLNLLVATTALGWFLYRRRSRAN